MTMQSKTISGDKPKNRGKYGCGRGMQVVRFSCVAVLFWASGAALAQSDPNPAVDTDPPVIEVDELDEARAATTQVFTVQIAEETELRSATLYHRRSGELRYNRAPLIALGSSGFYTASINTDPSDLRAIEYYLQARDATGNRTVSGFAFDPYIRTLTEAAATRIQSATTATRGQTPSSTPIQTRTPFYKNRWVQIAAGVVVVGIVASSLGGDEEDTRLVDVTFDLR